jgi:hypothetical protein
MFVPRVKLLLSLKQLKLHTPIRLLHQHSHNNLVQGVSTRDALHQSESVDR